LEGVYSIITFKQMRAKESNIAFVRRVCCLR